MSNNNNYHEVVITGAGLLSAAGDSLDAHLDQLINAAPKTAKEDYMLAGRIKPAKHLSDKRVMKVVSLSDAYGLVGIEKAKASAGIENGMHDTWRTGVYVGAPPASAWNNENYFDSIRSATGSDGVASEKEFGKTCMDARPTTLLLGLPNNVLCYAAVMLDAKGPNSNYTSGETSGQMAMMNAAKRIQYGKLDMAVAGGFCAHTEPVHENMFKANGCLKSSVTSDDDGSILADGSFFYILEEKSKAEERSANVIATYVGGELANEGHGNFSKVGENPALINALERCITKSGISTSEVGLVLTSGTDISDIDAAELKSVDSIFGKDIVKPALGSLGKVTGNLMEGGGLLEIALAPKLYERGELPTSMIRSKGYSTKIDNAKPYTMIIRASVFGDWSCLLIKKP